MQSPTNYLHSQSTVHVQTPTLMVNRPQFQTNLQQPPPAQIVPTNQPTNHHTQQQQANRKIQSGSTEISTDGL